MIGVSDADRVRWDGKYAGRSAGPPRWPAVFAPYVDEVPIAGEALDVACGSGAASVWLAERGLTVWGVDVSAAAIEQARDLATCHGLSDRCRFLVADLEAMPCRVSDFDLVTLVGVLQQCGAAPERALPACVAPLQAGGQLFLTTKNLEWEAFGDGRLRPDESHSWFRYAELTAVLAKCDVEVVCSGGFLPSIRRVGRPPW